MPSRNRRGPFGEMNDTLEAQEANNSGHLSQTKQVAQQHSLLRFEWLRVSLQGNTRFNQAYHDERYDCRLVPDAECVETSPTDWLREADPLRALAQ